MIQEVLKTRRLNKEIDNIHPDESGTRGHVADIAHPRYSPFRVESRFESYRMNSRVNYLDVDS